MEVHLFVSYHTGEVVYQSHPVRTFYPQSRGVRPIDVSPSHFYQAVWVGGIAQVSTVRPMCRHAAPAR